MRRISLFVLAALVLSQISCSDSEIYSKKALLMGTFAEIKIVSARGTPRTYLEKIADNAFNEVRKVENIFNFHDSNSELGRLNRYGPVEAYEVSGDLISLLKNAIYFSKLTDGAFDISIAPLEKIWSESAKNNKEPDNDKIEKTLPSVGIEKVLIDEKNNTVKLQQGMRLDFGAIAKGFAVDRATYVLHRYGINNAVVNVGGEIYCMGTGPHGIGWRIGIKHPRKEKTFIATLLLKDRAIATSGDYEQFYCVDGIKYSHIIDPRTGYPRSDFPASVSILADKCLTADALATGIYVMGREKGMELLNSLESIEGVIISDNANELNIEKSDGLQGVELES